jgi:hypothetical protein
VRISVTNVRTENELEVGFENLHQQGVEATLLLPDPHFLSWRNQIVSLAARNLLPAMYFLREFVAAGGLMGYSASITAYRLAGRYAGRILASSKPARRRDHRVCRAATAFEYQNGRPFCARRPGSIIGLLPPGSLYCLSSS